MESLNSNLPNVSGTWIGTVIYGDRYREYSGKTLQFQMDLHQQLQEIRGEAFDIGGVGMSPDKATVQGTMQGFSMQFVKQYAYSHVAKNGEVFHDKTKKGHLIQYQGLYNGITDEIRGTWSIRQTVKLFWLIPISFVVDGTWFMKRN